MAGLVYIFNLIVGTGALTMPKAFQAAGWLLSLVLIICLAFMSYLTVTFVTEAMAIANAKLRTLKQEQDNSSVSSGNEDDEISEQHPLLVNRPGKIESDIYEITERVELGQMAALFFNKVGMVLFYLCIVLYLYGDLSIYAAAVPKSIRDTACTFTIEANCTDNETLSESDPCWPSIPSLSRLSAYRIFVGAFTLALGPFVFFNAQKTKYLQYFTTVTRWLAFGVMIVLAVIRLSRNEGRGHPLVADFSGIPNLFGVCVYSFMCHHSLPSLITPIRNKDRLYWLIGGDYILILAFYALVSFTGIYAFAEINDLYTLNFLPDACNSENSITNIAFFEYFLALFPVFTLSTNFPIICITLRNNLKTLFYNPVRPYPWIVDRILFPLLALIPPIVIATITNQVEFLVGITGSYAGAGIQYVIPAALVYLARKNIPSLISDNSNKYISPFSHTMWVIFVCVWALVCMGFVTVNHIVTGK